VRRSEGLFFGGGTEGPKVEGSEKWGVK